MKTSNAIWAAILLGIAFYFAIASLGAYKRMELQSAPVSREEAPGPSAVETITGVSDVDRLDSLCADSLECKAMLAPRLDAVRQAL